MKNTDSNPTNGFSKNLTQETDAALFHALQAGETSALAVLYDRYSSFVYGLSLRILTNAQEAEDLTQEIFLLLWRSNTYNPNREAL